MPNTSPLIRTLVGAFALVALVAVGCGGGEEATPAGDTGGEDAAETEAAPASDAASGPTGSSTITGTISYDGDVPSLKPLNMDADPTCAGKHDQPVYPDMLVLGEGDTMANIFVKITNEPEGSYPAPSEAVVIDQRGCMYQPHVVGVMAGQPLKFLNSDGILHNVHLLPKENRELNIGMPATLTEKETTLNTPEPAFPVKCDVHPWMQAFVAVMSHPFFDVTDTDGQFTIENLPAGTYTVEVWHERLGTQTAEVTVGEGESATQDFSFTSPS